MSLLATTLPENSHDGYVAAAYIVFFALILIYVSIMALRLSRAERRLREQEARRGEPDPSRPSDEGLAAPPHNPPTAGPPSAATAGTTRDEPRREPLETV